MEARRPIGLYVLAALNLALAGAVVALFILRPAPGAPASSDPEKERAVAVALAGRGLYKQAAESYERYLATANLAPDQAAAVLYSVGELYMDKLSDCAEALARFERLRTLYPNAPVAGDAGKKTVACLERLGRSLDAKNALEAATSTGGAKGVKRAEPGQTVLARIGEQEITDRDLADEIAALPPPLRARMNGREERIEALRSLVQRRILAGTAARRGLAESPEVLGQVERAKEEILAAKVLEEEVYGKIEVTPAQVAAYMKDHAAELVGKDGKPLPPQQAQQLAAQKLYQEEERRLSAKLFESLLQAEKAEVYEDRVR